MKVLRLLVASALALMLAGCTADEPVGVPASDAGVPEGVVGDRELLGQPTVDLAEAVIALAAAMEEARFEAPRGDGMQDALADVAEQAQTVSAAADAAEGAAADAAVDTAGAVVQEAVATARAAAEAADDERRFLRRVARLDRRLLAAAEQWDRPGSQSELRAFLAELADDVGALRRQARRLRPAPADCTGMKVNRRQWVRTVRRRTLRLADQANSAGGRTYDDLRAAFRRLPLGVEPRVADDQDRPCWQETSPLPAAAEELRAAVEELEAALR